MLQIALYPGRVGMCIAAILLSFPAIAGDIASPVGLWKSFNDQGKPTGYIRITEQDGTLRGVVERGLPTDTAEKYCTACKDHRKNQRLIGMEILSGLHRNGEDYAGGEILEPFSGKTYRAKLTLLENGSKLTDFFSTKDRDNAQIQPPQSYKILFQNKKLIIDIAVNTKFSNPLGSYIWLNINGTPEITETDAWLNVHSASAGAVPLPKDITATIIRMLLDKYKNEQYYKIAREIIVKANVTPEGKILLVYRPNTLRRLVFKNLFL